MAEYIASTLYKGKIKTKFYPASHQYWVSEDGGKNYVRVSGVTTHLGIIDKSGALIGWAVDLSLNYLRDVWLGDKRKPVITEEHFYQASLQHTIKKEKAGDIGGKVHAWIESYIKKLNPGMPNEKEVQIGVNAFLDWVENNKVKFLSSERQLYSKKYKYMGTMDIEAKVNGELCLIDIKTSNGIYNTYNLQTAAYVKADEEESDRKYEGRWIIRLSKETESEYNSRMAQKNVERARKGKDAFQFPTYQVFEVKFLDNSTLEEEFEAYLASKKLYEWNAKTGFYAK